MTTEAKAKTTEPEKLTPPEWAKQLGPKEAPPHLVASASYLHGWKDHAYHYQAEPLLLSKEDFLAALKAAGEYPAATPHAPAFGKTVGDRFKDFKPALSKADVAKAAADAKTKTSGKGT